MNEWRTNERTSGWTDGRMDGWMFSMFGSRWVCSSTFLRFLKWPPEALRTVIRCTRCIVGETPNNIIGQIRNFCRGAGGRPIHAPFSSQKCLSSAGGWVHPRPLIRLCPPSSKHPQTVSSRMSVQATMRNLLLRPLRFQRLLLRSTFLIRMSWYFL